nr:hypothetical protein [Tanacetum cinerariifolium]
MALFNQLLETCATLTKKVGTLKQDKIAQAIEITKLKQRVRRVESSADTVMDDQEDVSKQRRGRGEIAELDAKEDITLETVDETDKTELAKVEEVIEVVNAAKLITKVVTTAVATTAATLITAATTITAALVPKASASRRIRGVIIQDPEEAATASEIMQSEVKSKDKGKGFLGEDP